MTLPTPAEAKIQSVLLQVAQADGPLRLFQPRGGAKGSGLLRSIRGPAARLVAKLTLDCLVEVPRTPGLPRLLRLSAQGVRTLVQCTPPAKRTALARLVSPLYRDRVLRAWKELAQPAELVDFHACCAEFYGDLLGAPPASATASSPEAAAFKRALAKELVLSWERTQEPEARRGITRAMLSLGLREIGRPGERTPFTGRLHVSEDTLFQGDPVEIIDPGWTVTDQLGEFLLRKAHVKAIADHA